MQVDYTFKHKHILGLEQMSTDDIFHIINTARSFKEISTRPIKKVPTLRGKTIVNFSLNLRHVLACHLKLLQNG